MYLFLNELSVPVGSIHFEDAKRVFKAFVATVRAVRNAAPSAALFAHQNIRNLSIGRSYNVAFLRNLPDCKEESQYLSRLQDRAPMSLSLAEVRDCCHEMVQYFYPIDFEGNPSAVEVEGLGLAHFFDGAAVSFNSDSMWSREMIPLVLHSMQPDSSILESEVSARNFSSAGHVSTRSEWLSSFQISNRVADGAELWARREELFPYLEFIPRTKSQVSGMKVGEHLFLQAHSHLEKLNEAIREWDPTTMFAPEFPFQVRPESQSRINDGLVDFSERDGSVSTFSEHIYLAPPPHRLHFLIKAAPRKVAVIGHLGRKLGIG